MSRIRFEIEKFCMILYFVFLGIIVPVWLLTYGSSLSMIFGAIWYGGFFFYIDEAKNKIKAFDILGPAYIQYDSKIIKIHKYTEDNSDFKY